MAIYKIETWSAWWPKRRRTPPYNLLSQTRILPPETARRSYVCSCWHYLKGQENNFVWPPCTTLAIIRAGCAATSAGAFGPRVACSSEPSTVTMLAPTSSRPCLAVALSPDPYLSALSWADLSASLDLKTILAIIEAESWCSLEYFLLQAIHFFDPLLAGFMEPQFQHKKSNPESKFKNLNWRKRLFAFLVWSNEPKTFLLGALQWSFGAFQWISFSFFRSLFLRFSVSILCFLEISTESSHALGIDRARLSVFVPHWRNDTRLVKSLGWAGVGGQYYAKPKIENAKILNPESKFQKHKPKKKNSNKKAWNPKPHFWARMGFGKFTSNSTLVCFL